jgi:hypothetical protein
MKRKILAIMLGFVLMLGTFTGCTVKDENPNEQYADRYIKLTMYYYNAGFGGEHYEAMAADYMENYDDKVYIDMVPKTDSPTMRTQITTNDCDADIVQLSVDMFGQTASIENLSDLYEMYPLGEEGKVKMLPEMKINEADKSSFDSIFTSALSFGLICNMTMNDAIKLGNTAAAMSLSKIGEQAAIPELDDVLANSGLKEKLDAAIKGETVEATASAAIEPAPLNPEHHVEPAPVAEPAPVVQEPAVTTPIMETTTDMMQQAVAPEMPVQQMPVEQPVVQQMPVEQPMVQPQMVQPQMVAEGVMPQVVMPQPVEQQNTTNV